MPRLKPKRMILFSISLIFITLFFINLCKKYDKNFNNNNNVNNISPMVTTGHKSSPSFEFNKIVSEPNRQKFLNDTNGHNYNFNIFNQNHEKPWFMTNGTLRPRGDNFSQFDIWPEHSLEDRIVNQLMYYPKDYDPTYESLKTIVLYFGGGDLPMGRTKFIMDRCPINRCNLSTNIEDVSTADAVFFKEGFQWPKHKRPAHQIWILFLLEAPLHTKLWTLRNLGDGVFNWTVTYRHDSDIVAPYEKFVAFDQQIDKQIIKKNWSEGKSKQVAWFVSNCRAKNRRLEYARELSQYIQVDIYGRCGEMSCPRNEAKKCLEMLNRDYRFYLAFENSNCRDYITEKFFVNGLGQNSLDYNLIPIVMGAHPNDYVRASPNMSYIHVDDFESPKQLAQYLHNLSSNPELYNQYFRWKSSGEFINTYFWCRVCALLHSDNKKPSISYADITKWWSPDGVCNHGEPSWHMTYNRNLFLFTLFIVFIN